MMVESSAAVIIRQRFDSNIPHTEISRKYVRFSSCKTYVPVVEYEKDEERMFDGGAIWERHADVQSGKRVRVMEQRRAAL